MSDTLFVPNKNVKRLADEVKNLYGYNTYTQTIEAALLMLKEAKKKEVSYQEKAIEFQQRTRKFLGKEYNSYTEEQRKAFFDDLSGGF
ncbi:Rv0623-like transcription factor [Bartonella sp. CDC_skunk]|uniref:type II toxin-antitoxin system VapB family antitoxin n=1 Tax=unclassified Bartonella TaxID=2645622 RepID=UPI00099A22A6|nr:MULTISPECIES: type II toxin-antitoxin system VapB family antitoxin [unclassified Bartonella]AQX21095.1 Rv0623-like transcription factor [Bartonella sp. CDC_skunk]AQX26354.1 Rv0623-like transcription factor [Bartonella sp. Raccoon60]